MPRSILSAKLQSFKEKFRKRNYQVQFQPSSRKSIIMMLSLIIICSMFYLWQTNKLATKGYKIKNLEDQASELREQNKKFELQIAELRSTDRITKEVESLQMVEVARVEYLKADGSAVALNR